MIAYACWDCYLLKEKEVEEGGQGEEGEVENGSGNGPREGMEEVRMEAMNEPSATNVKESSASVQTVTQSKAWEQAELHESQQNYPEVGSQQNEPELESPDSESPQNEPELESQQNESELESQQNKSQLESQQNEFELSLNKEAEPSHNNEESGLIPEGAGLTTILENVEFQEILSDFLQGLQEKVRTTKEDLLLHSIHILDSGGQPQFHELIAIFLSHISGFVSVFKLNEKLSDHGEVVVYDDGEPINDPYESYYSHEQVIRHNLQALMTDAMQHGMEEIPSIGFVGTFLDKQDECSETPDDKDKRLHGIITEMLPPAIQERVVTYGNSLHQATFRINARAPKKRDFDTVDKLKEVLLEKSKVQPRDLPLKWHSLEVALHFLMEKLN